MPDLTTLSDDDTRAEFARMREATLYEIHLPGAAAARRTVSRRRHRAAMASAGLAVVVVAGAIGVALTPPGQSQLASLPPPVMGQSDGGATGSALPEGWLYAVARENAAEPTEVFEMALKPDAAGPYRFKVVCSGSGTGVATLTTGKETATAPVTCGTPPVSSPIQLDVTGNAERLELRIAWDPGIKPSDTPEGWSLMIVGMDKNES